MARSTIQDQPPTNTAASFERQPPEDLEDTLPFSLLNALLEGLDGAVPYEPPPLAQLEEITLETKPSEGASDPPEAAEPTDKTPQDEQASVPDKLVVGADVDDTPAAPASEPEEVSEPLTSMAEPPTTKNEAAPLVADAKDKAKDSEAPAPEASREISDTDPKPLPLNFPKVSNKLPPPPPPPRPKSRRFSASTNPFSERQERPKPTTKGPPSNQQWPRRGFQGAPVDKPASFDPINKAIRIFESLSNEPEDEKDLPQTDAPSAKAGLSPPPSAPESTDSKPPVETIEVAPEPKEEEATTPQAPAAQEDLAELDTVKIQLPRNRVAKPSVPEPQPQPKPKPKPSKGLTNIAPKDLSPPVETAQPPTPPLKPKAELTVQQEPVQSKPKTPAASPVPSAQESRTLPPVPVRRRRRKRVPLNPWTAKRSAPLQGTESRQDRNEHINKTLGELAKTLESTFLTSPNESPPADALTPKVELRQTFSEDQSAPPSRSASKLVPRALSKQDTDAALASTDAEQVSPALDQPDFEITAPTTLIAEDAPISPFTKAAREQIRPSPSPGSQESPFTLANSSRIISQAPADAEQKVFASPFSTALKKRQNNTSEQTSGSTSAPRIAPISPPGTHPDQEAALAQGQLPAPTYSFATMGIPSAQGKAPSAAPPTPMTAAAVHAQVPPPAPPRPPGPFTPATQPSPEKAPLPEPATDRAQRPLPEPNTWGILTWVLCIVCGIFFLVYLFEIYQTLSGSNKNKPTIIRPHQEETIQEEPSANNSRETSSILTPAPQVSLSDAMGTLAGFLSADTKEIRDQYLVEDEKLHDRMTEHYASFPMQAGAPRQVVNGGTFADTYRSYVVVKTQWADNRETDALLIKDASDNYRFSWYGFEQSRNQLLRHYAETSWTGWTQFFVEIKPIDPTTLPTGSVLDNLYYKITAPEDPEFEAIGYVDGLSSMATDFKERFPNSSTYKVYADLMRGEPFHDDPRPLFRITRLIRASWDATP